MGGGDITARVIAEAANPTINVVWGPSEDQFGQMKAEATLLDRVLANRPAVELTTVGMEAGPGSLGYRFTDARPGQAPVADLMGAILDAVAPLRHFHDDDFTAERRRNDSPANFAPHLSIISFDGPQRPGLVAETAELLAELGIGGPATAVFDRVHLLAFSSLDWTGPYWQTMQWELLHSWRLEHP